ncbi:MAG: hypothetical protein RLZZ546_631 [Bacteroidota bacterium]|jgi:uncharacterized iron-regulated membrane protein
MKKSYKILIVFILFTLIDISFADAQCAMCRAASESNLNNGGKAGLGLNSGILYLLSLPYILFCSLAFVWWRKRKAEEKVQKISFIEERKDL